MAVVAVWSADSATGRRTAQTVRKCRTGVENLGEPHILGRQRDRLERLEADIMNIYTTSSFSKKPKTNKVERARRPFGMKYRTMWHKWCVGGMADWMLQVVRTDVQNTASFHSLP
jgi:hypothetical protein